MTHLAIFDPPSKRKAALDQVAAWLESPSLVLLAESAAHWDQLQRLTRATKARGPQLYEARIAALCLEHGVSALYSAERDYNRVRGLSVINPLVETVSPAGPPAREALAETMP